MLDYKIINGTIVDGTGGAKFRGDVGVKDGRIAAIGKVDGEAHETIDAAGKIVAPGFIDAHTHYDAQIFWDPKLTPSCYHGITTVIGGMCGFSVAPMSAEAAPYLRRMLARVEGMPLQTLEIAVPWGTWSSFGEYLALAEGNVGLNIGFFCGHSALRRVVLGERAVGEKATAEELATMQAMLAQSIEEGALGFSTSVSPGHHDGEGNPVPSRWAEHSEIIALGSVVKNYPGTGLEPLPDIEFGPGMAELLNDFSVAGDRPVNWNVLAINGRADAAEIANFQLSVSDFPREHGGEVLALTVPCTPNLFLNLRSGAGWDTNLGVWREVFKLPHDARKEKFMDPAIRRQLARDAALTPSSSPVLFLAAIGGYIVVSVEHAENKKYEGRKIGEIASEEGREPIDVMLDIALADDLLTTFMPYQGGDDRNSYEIRAKIWRDDRALIGASDAGAHLDMIDTFAFSTTVLEKGVREFAVIELEDAIYRMTGRTARYLGLLERGIIRQGYHADLVVFDAAAIKSSPSYMRFDVPGGAGRIYAEAEGIDAVFVNGVPIVRGGTHTGALPGTVLRSGRDTKTVFPGEMREDRRERAPA